MKRNFIKSLLAIAVASCLLAVSGSASAYWHHGYWHHGWGGARVYVGVGPGYYGRPYYRHCGWVPGHWYYGRWVYAHRACW